MYILCFDYMILHEPRQVGIHGAICRGDLKISMVISMILCETKEAGENKAHICIAPQKTTSTLGSYKTWLLVSPLYWALEPECQMLMFMWSFGPLVQTVQNCIRLQASDRQTQRAPNWTVETEPAFVQDFLPATACPRLAFKLEHTA